MKGERLRILVVNRMMGHLLGGGEVFDIRVAAEMHQMGHQVCMLTLEGPLLGRHRERYAELTMEGVRVPQLTRMENALRRHNQRVAALLRYLNVCLFEKAVMRYLLDGNRVREYDVVYGCSMMWLPEWLLKRYEVGVVNWLPGIPSNLQRKQLQALVPHPRHALFTHGDPVEYLQVRMGWKDGKDFHVIAPGIAPEAISQAKSLRASIREQIVQRKEDIVGITVARLVEVKNHQLLLRGLSEAIAKGVTQLKWLMVGSGPERVRLEKIASHLGITPHIIWCGNVDSDAVHGYYAAADVFALTSRYENFSLATLEAMAHGLPVVATKVGFLQHLVEQSGGGVLVSMGNPHELAQAICDLAANPSRRQALGSMGREYTSRMSWHHTAQQVLRLCYAVA